MTTIHDILRSPHVTEKSTLEKEKSGGLMVTFEVRPDVKKQQIKEAVEEIFDVKVEKVRTARYSGKIKRQCRYSGRQSAWKKAYVTLRQGETIEALETV